MAIYGYKTKKGSTTISIAIHTSKVERDKAMKDEKKHSKPAYTFVPFQRKKRIYISRYMTIA